MYIIVLVGGFVCNTVLKVRIHIVCIYNLGTYFFFSQTVTRKRPLAYYQDYRPIDTEHLLSDIMKLEADHDSMGLRQINTDRATSDEDGDTHDVSFTPEEIVLRSLQVTVEEQHPECK